VSTVKVGVLKRKERPLNGGKQMKNLWLKTKLYCLKLWHGISDRELELAEYRRKLNEFEKAYDDALLYGIGISRIEPKDFYGVGVAELTLAELRDQAINSPYHAMRAAELWQDYTARQLPIDVKEVKKRVKKSRKVGRKKRGKVV